MTEPHTTAELPLTSAVVGPNGATPPTEEKKSGKGGGTPFVSRPDHPTVKREILAQGALKPKGFTTQQARRWVSALKLGKKPPGIEFVYKRIREMVADGLIERVGTNGKKCRTYRVKNAMVQQTPVMVTEQPPADEAEAALKLLEELGEDVSLARKALQLRRAREIKAELEAELK